MGFFFFDMRLNRSIYVKDSKSLKAYLHEHRSIEYTNSSFSSTYSRRYMPRDGRIWFRIGTINGFEFLVIATPSECPEKMSGELTVHDKCQSNVGGNLRA